MYTRFSYLNRALRWLAQSKIGVQILGPPVLALTFALFFRSEWAFRYAGNALQVAGVLTVAFGVADTRRRFNQPSMWRRFLAWLKRRPRRQARTHTVSFSSTVNASSGFDVGLLSSVWPDDWPVDQQLKALKGELNALTTALATQRNELKAAVNGVSEKVRAEATIRERRDVEIETLVRTAQTGGLDISAMGAVWLIAGLVLATIAPEMGDWFKVAPPPPAVDLHTDFV